mgnify:CR=1 FL=1
MPTKIQFSVENKSCKRILVNSHNELGEDSFFTSLEDLVLYTFSNNDHTDGACIVGIDLKRQLLSYFLENGADLVVHLGLWNGVSGEKGNRTGIGH